MTEPTGMTEELRASIIKENKEDERLRPSRKKEIRELQKELVQSIRWHKSVRKVWMKRYGSDLANKAHLLMEPLVFRSMELIESALEDTRKGRVLPAIITTRNHYELTGTIAYLLKSLRKYWKEEIDANAVLEVQKRLTLGVGREVRKEFEGIDVDAVHCNDRVKAVDEIDPHDGDKEVFWRFYGWLSEYAHFNYDANTMTLRYYADGSVCFYDYDKVLLETAKVLRHLTVSAHKLELFYCEATHIITHKEKKAGLMAMPKRSYTFQRILGETVLKVLRVLHRLGLWHPKKKK